MKNRSRGTGVEKEGVEKDEGAGIEKKSRNRKKKQEEILIR